MTASSKLVFFGTEQFSVPSLLALIDAGYTVAAIVTKPDSRRGRGKKLFVHPIKQIGLDHHIPVLQPIKLRDIEEDLRVLKADAAILVSYGKIIPERILQLFTPIGIINIHPSALPKYRGPSPIEATILAGDTSTAVSIMQLDSGMDTGPVYVQQSVVLTGKETKLALSIELAKAGAKLLIQTLPSILDGTLTANPQQKNDVSVTSLVTKNDGVLNPTTDTAMVLERKIRAYQGYPKSHLTVLKNDVIVTSAIVVESPSEHALIIPCADATYLKINELIAPSGRHMSGADFLRGYVK